MDDIWPVSEEYLRDLWVVYWSECVIQARQACRSVIVSRLLSGGISFVDPGSGKVTDAAFTRRVQREFVPFARDVIDHLCVEGFACFMVDTRTGTPHVIPPGVTQFAVKLSGTTLRRSMVMTRQGQGAPDKKAMFLVDNFPDNRGIPHSPMASYRRTHAFRGMVEVNTSTADYSAARPMVYTSIDSDKAFDRRHVYRNALDAGIDASAILTHVDNQADCDNSVRDVHRRANDLLTGLNEANEASHARAMSKATTQQSQLAADLNGGRIDPRSVRLDPITGLPVFDSSMLQRPGDAYNIMPLPVDAKVQATVAPTSRSDIVSIFENAQQMACVAMGVPGSEVGLSSGRRLAADAEMSEGVLHNTLARFRTLLSSCLIDVYTSLYGERPGLEVVFPSFINQSATNALFTKDLMTYEAYKKYLISVMGTRPGDLEKEDPRRREDQSTREMDFTKRQRVDFHE